MRGTNSSIMHTWCPWYDRVHEWGFAPTGRSGPVRAHILLPDRSAWEPRVPVRVPSALAGVRAPAAWDSRAVLPVAGWAGWSRLCRGWHSCHHRCRHCRCSPDPWTGFSDCCRSSACTRWADCTCRPCRSACAFRVGCPAGYRSASRWKSRTS